MYRNRKKKDEGETEEPLLAFATYLYDVTFSIP